MTVDTKSIAVRPSTYSSLSFSIGVSNKRMNSFDSCACAYIATYLLLRKQQTCSAFALQFLSRKPLEPPLPLAKALSQSQGFILRLAVAGKLSADTSLAAIACGHRHY